MKTAGNFETRYDTSNYEDKRRSCPLLVGKKKQLVQKIITKFPVVRPKPYPVKIQKDENENKNKDFKKPKQSISKNVRDFDNFIK